MERDSSTLDGVRHSRALVNREAQRATRRASRLHHRSVQNVDLCRQDSRHWNDVQELTRSPWISRPQCASNAVSKEVMALQYEGSRTTCSTTGVAGGTFVRFGESKDGAAK